MACWANFPTEFGIDFTKQELLEVSIVPIPANANALVQGRASGSGAQADRRERAALLPAYTEPTATPLARCAIDHQRERHRQEQRDTEEPGLDRIPFAADASRGDVLK